MVPRKGLEPPHLSAPEPKSGASTNFATWASGADSTTIFASLVYSAPMPVEHYENFPVASLLVPAKMRQPIEVIYHFARSADDIADEGDALPAERLASLAEYQAELDRIAAGDEPQTPLFVSLAQVIQQHTLPIGLFSDLLDAFAQDVVKTRYADYPELLDYCRRSANPVGRLVLSLFGRTEALHLEQSDCICTALQLINFWQDVAVDWEKERIYIPLTDLPRFKISESDIASSRWSANWAALMDFEIDRAQKLMLRGAPLVHTLPGRLGWEIRLTIQGGLRILERLRQVRGNVFEHRPKLGKWDWLVLAGRSLTM